MISHTWRGTEMTRLGLLLWKNGLIRLRNPVRTFFEIIWPLLIFVILISIRLSIDLRTREECHFPARALPSAGVLPWVQSIYCNLGRLWYTNTTIRVGTHFEMSLACVAGLVCLRGRNGNGAMRLTFHPSSTWYLINASGRVVSN